MDFSNKKLNKIIFGIGPIVCSLICGIVAIVLYNGYVNSTCLWSDGEPFCWGDPNRWIVIPIAFLLGFLAPFFAIVIYYIMKYTHY